MQACLLLCLVQIPAYDRAPGAVLSWCEVENKLIGPEPRNKSSETGLYAIYF